MLFAGAGAKCARPSSISRRSPWRAKYPPSLLYLLMTLGPALILLARVDGTECALWRPLEIFGRVPLFHYLIHLPLIHGAAVLYSFVAYGRADWLFRGVTVVPGFGPKFPSGYGFGLWGVYLVWLGSVVVLYPLCRWFAAVKRRRAASGFSAIYDFCYFAKRGQKREKEIAVEETG